MTLLKIALTKGRTEKQVIPLLEKSGVDCSGLLNKKRRLIVSVADKYQFVLAKGPDVMTYLTNGACDIGIVGSDILEEQGRTENQLLDLNVGKCRFILASTSSFDPKKERRKVIGTKYPNITQRYFESIGDSFTQRKSCDVVNELESSVPRSSMISKSQSNIFWCAAMASASFSNTPLLNISNNWNAVK